MSSITYAQAVENVREHDDLYDRHWNECRQISQYEEENKKLRALLVRCTSLLRVAVFVNYHCEDDWQELRQEIDELLGGADNE